MLVFNKGPKQDHSNNKHRKIPALMPALILLVLLFLQDFAWSLPQAEQLLWPLPLHLSSSTPTTYVSVKGLDLVLKSNQVDHITRRIIEQAFDRMKHSVRTKCPIGKSKGIKLQVQLKSKEIPRAHSLGQQSEAYTLVSTSSQIALQADTFVGAIRALQTLSQLFLASDSECLMAMVSLQDEPRFSHRGLMLDQLRELIQILQAICSTTLKKMVFC
jgi:N-acetyl-beta-hexosaminidase